MKTGGFLIGKFFSGRALSPVTGIVRKARSITASNMDLRLGEGNGKDEIGRQEYSKPIRFKCAKRIIRVLKPGLGF